MCPLSLHSSYEGGRRGGRRWNGLPPPTFQGPSHLDHPTPGPQRSLLLLGGPLASYSAAPPPLSVHSARACCVAHPSPSPLEENSKGEGLRNERKELDTEKRQAKVLQLTLHSPVRLCILSIVLMPVVLMGDCCLGVQVTWYTWLTVQVGTIQTSALWCF